MAFKHSNVAGYTPAHPTKILYIVNFPFIFASWRSVSCTYFWSCLDWSMDLSFLNAYLLLLVFLDGQIHPNTLHTHIVVVLPQTGATVILGGVR